jgi:hypothetical protein
MKQELNSGFFSGTERLIALETSAGFSEDKPRIGFRLFFRKITSDLS